jgi:hypothetical protein
VLFTWRSGALTTVTRYAGSMRGAPRVVMPAQCPAAAPLHARAGHSHMSIKVLGTKTNAKTSLDVAAKQRKFITILG